ncbi:hypothetical protein NDU88_006065 [Pleurodeles waltl]|uniref:Uncharacterized protein n=1 Tax=Pleurodeles waltl TaxID=8319 RepID=A0AAV7VKV8_PLEWA|nr:hypothetical protein NDU88_006065 [Pleurodeles waltl]
MTLLALVVFRDRGTDRDLKVGFLCLRTSMTGIGAGRHRSSRTWRNRRLEKPPGPEQKPPLRGGAERRSNRNQREL